MTRECSVASLGLFRVAEQDSLVFYRLHLRNRTIALYKNIRTNKSRTPKSQSGNAFLPPVDISNNFRRFASSAFLIVPRYKKIHIKIYVVDHALATSPSERQYLTSRRIDFEIGLACTISCRFSLRNTTAARFDNRDRVLRALSLSVLSITNITCSSRRPSDRTHPTKRRGISIEASRTTMAFLPSLFRQSLQGHLLSFLSRSPTRH